MPVGGDEAQRANLVLRDPLGGFRGVGAGVDRIMAERHAARHFLGRNPEFGGEFAGLDLGIDPADQHLVREPLVEHLQPPRDPPCPAGGHDHRIGARAVARRTRERDHEPQEADGPDEEQEGEDPAQHDGP